MKEGFEKYKGNVWYDNPMNEFFTFDSYGIA